jgi:hypothetical protein
MIDGDPATDGLSLFLLGPQGMDQVKSFSDENTFVGALERFKAIKSAKFQARSIHRRGEGDHGVTYEALISGRGLYGDKAFMGQVVPDLNQATFRDAIKDLFRPLRERGEYDYVLVDTRGGFAFESADICALADSFIIVTEPDNTSFYQDRNLYSSIAAAAAEMNSPSLLRAIIVNKSVDSVSQVGVPYLDTLETSFRNELVREFKVTYRETYPVPVSLDALMAYKVQKIPYVSAPESSFCSATLAAFSDILQIVTSRWSIQQVDQWNELISKVAAAISEKQKFEDNKRAEAAADKLAIQQVRDENAERGAKLESLTRDFAASMESQRGQYEDKIVSLQRELQQQSRLYEREYERTQMLISSDQGARMPSDGKPSSYSDAASSRQKRSTYFIVGVIILVITISAFAYYSYLSNRTARALEQRTQNYEAQLSDLRSRISQSPTPGSLQLPNAKSSSTTEQKTDPIPTVPSTRGDSVSGNYGVLLSTDTDLIAKGPGANSGLFEAQLARQLGYVSTSMYKKDQLFVTAVLFDTKAGAEAALGQLSKNKRWKTAEIVSMNIWCPAKVPQESVSIKGFSIPVWACSIAVSAR